MFPLFPKNESGSFLGPHASHMQKLYNVLLDMLKTQNSWILCGNLKFWIFKLFCLRSYDTLNNKILRPNIHKRFCQMSRFKKFTWGNRSGLDWKVSWKGNRHEGSVQGWSICWREKREYKQNKRLWSWDDKTSSLLFDRANIAKCL